MMNEIIVCDEHIDIGIEMILDLNKLPIIKTLEQGAKCSRCNEQAQYKVIAGDEFEG